MSRSVRVDAEYVAESSRGTGDIEAMAKQFHMKQRGASGHLQSRPDQLAGSADGRSVEPCGVGKSSGRNKREIDPNGPPAPRIGTGLLVVDRCTAGDLSGALVPDLGGSTSIRTSYSDVVWRSVPGHGKMFHVEQEGSDSNQLMAVAEQIFGDRLELARRYHESLATAGVERGLIGPREVPRLWERHILNCAAIGELIDEGETVVDIGSGAGLPGIPLAIARPDLRVTLVEPLLRRTVYLAEFIEEHELNILVVRGRAEQPGVKKEAGGADVVTSRAVAPLEKLAKWSLPLVHEHGRMLALKGSSAGEEIERDRTSLTRMGAGKLEVVECGVGLLPTPTIVVRAVREPRRLSRH